MLTDFFKITCSFILSKIPRRKSSVLLYLMTSIVGTAQALTLIPPELKVEKVVLENGLTVLLSEDHSVPMISYHTWYKVGSKDEHVGITGSAHMLEHMMFKGAKKYSGDEFDRIVQENGMAVNAFTSYDYTGFYQSLPSSKLDLMIEMELDRLSSLNMKEADLKSELQVVAEERRYRTENSPAGILREKTLSEIFKTGPYSWPVVGRMEDIQKYQIPPLQYFYDSFYGPNNAVLVIVGDFKTQDVLKKIKNTYGRLKIKPVPERKYPTEKVQEKFQEVTLKKDIQGPLITLAFRAPGIDSEDVYALDILSSILGDGSSSRLYQKLVYEDQVATGAGSSNMTLALDGLFYISASVRPGKEVSKVSESIFEIVERIKNSKVTAAELELAKTTIYKSNIEGLKTMDGTARSLAVNEILFGDYQRLFTDLKKMEAVTVDDVARVAKKYLRKEQCTVGYLLPCKGAQCE